MNPYNYVRYIPPVDASPKSTYVGCYRVSPPRVSRIPDPMGTNPNCPVKLCSLCASSNCKCNMNHMRNPWKHRYFVYKWNQY